MRITRLTLSALATAAVVLGTPTAARSESPALLAERQPHATEVLGAVYRRMAGDLPAPPTAADLPRTDEASDPVVAPLDTLIGEPPPALAAAPEPSRAAPVPRSTAARRSGTWAVIVGINDYPGADHDLLFAVNDANDVDAALSSAGVPADHRLVLRDGQASAAAISGALDWLVDHAGPDALAVFSYAGHAREHDSSRQAIVASDGVEITDSAMANRLSQLAANRVWINMASCFGGGFDELVAPGRFLTAAAPAGSRAYESTEYGRSYLGEYFVHREVGKGGTLQDAFDAAATALAADHPGRELARIDDSHRPFGLRPPAAASAAAQPASNPPVPSPNNSGGAPAKSPGPSPTTTTTQPPRDDCRNVTLGVVTCGSAG